MDENPTINDYINLIQTHTSQIETCLRRIEDIRRAELANQPISDVVKLQNLIQPDNDYVEWIYSGIISATPSDIAKAWVAFNKLREARQRHARITRICSFIARIWSRNND